MSADADHGLMRRNIGIADRMARLGIGVVLAAAGLYLAYRINIWAGALPVLIGAFSILEALYGWCAVYALLGKNTCPISAR